MSTETITWPQAAVAAIVAIAFLVFMWIVKESDK